MTKKTNPPAPLDSLGLIGIVGIITGKSGLMRFKFTLVALTAAVILKGTSITNDTIFIIIGIFFAGLIFSL